ncbi:type VI secretion system Vgr family protein [Desulfonatronum thioautotrophicum]|uniref:type VI secretion system Vgr family protein n=1 Tax=Desulfonatronum thioautotrophicum TaxID=617001 RepID=UPI00069A0D1C|nr:type VI secretion system tip protein TssI/VgrG [Desulfonatronum thioautotrophicum]
MPRKTDKAFAFISQGFSEETFDVVSFSGEEELGTAYRFEIMLQSGVPDLDLDVVMREPARLVLKSQVTHGPDMTYHGILASLEQLHQTDKTAFYRVELRPRLWWLGLIRQNQVFLDKRVDQFLAEVLKDAGLSLNQDFEMRFKERQLPWEYVCQYNESHLDFFSRWLEREGGYYWFEQEERVEKLLVADTYIAHVPLPGYEHLDYRPRTDQADAPTGRHVSAFTLKQTCQPRNLLVKDYDYRKPNLEMAGRAQIQEHGRGEVYLYGEQVRSRAEAERLARVRAEEYGARQKVFHGQSSLPALRPGYLFTLRRHFRESFNQQYLTVSVRHEGGRGGAQGTDTSDIASGGHRAETSYRNSFTCIPATTQFRPAQVTPRPRIAGTISATIDAAGSGQYAELDEHGRYKVRLPFDRAERGGGKASAWLRMASPYAGENCGLHFPLLKGTEVLLTFIDGDPDRPVIAHAVPNFEKQSVIRDTNSPANAIRSAGGNQIVMGDKKGQEFIGLYSPFHDSGIVLGSHEPGGGGSIGVSTAGGYELFVMGAANQAVLGSKNNLTGGVVNDICAGLKSDLAVAMRFGATLANRIEYDKGPEFYLGEKASILKQELSTVGMKSYTIAGGFDDAMSQEVKNAQKALAMGIGGTAAAGLGIMGVSAPFDPHFLKDASMLWKNAAFFGGLTALLAGGWLTMKAAKDVENLVKAVEAKASTLSTAEMTFNPEGAHIKVNCNVSPDATFSTLVTLTDPFGRIQESTLTVSLDEEKALVLKSTTRQDAGDDGEAAAVQVILGSKGITLVKPGGARIVLDAAGAVMERMEPDDEAAQQLVADLGLEDVALVPGIVRAGRNTAKLECGDNSVEVTPTGVNIVAPSPSDNGDNGGNGAAPASVRIDADGFIKLG